MWPRFQISGSYNLLLKRLFKNKKIAKGVYVLICSTVSLSARIGQPSGPEDLFVFKLTSLLKTMAALISISIMGDTS